MIRSCATHIMRRLIISLVVLPSLLLASVIYAQSATCVKIGVLGTYAKPTSGYTRFFGQEAYRGASIAIKQMNVKKTPCFKLVKIETGTALANIPPLIQEYAQKGVHLFIGLGLSSQIDVAISALKKTHSLLITPTGSSDKIAKETRVISFFPSRQEVADAIIQYLGRNNVKSVSIIYSIDKDYSAGMATTFKNDFSKVGGKVDHMMSVNSNLISLKKYEPILKKFSSGYVFIPMSDLDAAKTVMELERLGINANLIGSDAWATYSNSIEKLIDSFVTKRTVHAVIPVMYTTDMHTKVNLAFVRLFTEKYSSKPTDLEAFSYDGARLMGKMLKTCGASNLRKDPATCLRRSLPFQSTTGQIKGGTGLYLARAIMMKSIIMGKRPDANK